MELLHLRLQDFRNIAFASLTWEGPLHFLLGANGQGKTNLLESVGLLTALRSFRLGDTAPLIRQGASEARLFARVCRHEDDTADEVVVILRPSGKEVHLNGQKLTRLSEFLGLFPTVTCAHDDLSLLRGAPSLRRRFMDATLSAAVPAYLGHYRRYGQAMEARNALLKAGEGASGFESFERLMAVEAVALTRWRLQMLRELEGALQQYYAGIGSAGESPSLTYAASVQTDDEGVFLEQLARQRPRDLRARTTLVGPHRDDFHFLFNGKIAREYASEGQQRTLVLSLRLAQSAYFQAHTGVLPLLLADDILGQLDQRRREAFWQCLDARTQVIATGTEPPHPVAGRVWRVLRVQEGSFAGQEG